MKNISMKDIYILLIKENGDYLGRRGIFPCKKLKEPPGQ